MLAVADGPRPDVGVSFLRDVRYLEHARQNQTPVQLVFAGNIDAPVTALVRARNGPTFEFVIGAAVIRMDLAAVAVRTS